MARQMVGQRKGPPTPPNDPPEDSGEGADVVECPNCKCTFDEATGKVVSMPDDAQPGGAALDALDSAEPVPGKFGTAADAARGTDALSHLLGSLTGGR